MVLLISSLGCVSLVVRDVQCCSPVPRLSTAGRNRRLRRQSRSVAAKCHAMDAGRDATRRNLLLVRFRFVLFPTIEYC